MHQKPLTKTIAVFEVFFLIFFLLFNVGTLHAQSSDNPYLISNIFVSTNGKNPALARVNATAEAQRNAFVILLGRLSIDSGFADSVTNDEISDMVHSQQITNEKISGNNYSATFNIAFSEEFVSHILSNKNIMKGTAKAETYLIFPVKITGKKTLLWEKNNDWKSAFENYLKSNPNPRVKVPSGNVEDISFVHPDSIDNANFSNFESLLNKYKSDVAMVAYFDFDQIENKVNITLKIVRKFQKKQVKLNFVNVNNLEPAALVTKVTEKTIEYINSNKSQNTEVSKVIANIDVLITGLGDWLAIKERLQNMNFIEQLKVNSISKDLVKITIKYDGDSGDLINLFSKEGLNLNKGDGQYFLSINTSSQTTPIPSTN